MAKARCILAARFSVAIPNADASPATLYAPYAAAAKPTRWCGERSLWGIFSLRLAFKRRRRCFLRLIDRRPRSPSQLRHVLSQIVHH
jgi:hypothetical protein